MGKYLSWTLLILLFAGISACKSRKQPESFPWREALSGPEVDSQVTALRKGLPEAEIKLVPKGINITLASGILFGLNTSKLSEEAKEPLGNIARVLQQFPESRLLVEGHTDITGTTEYNQSLSERRAASVKKYLVSLGLDKQRITTVGRGETAPIATNSTKKGQEKNRRVELFIDP